MYHGGGGFKHEEVYNMPTWMRNFHIGKINEFIENKNEEIKKTQGQPVDNSKVHRPNISPSSTFNF